LIRDPKERTISAAPVRDRVVHHAIMNHYDAVFDRHLIYDCYACRVGKGTHRAVLRAFHFAKSSRYFLKMDVRKYFDSIDHAALKALLSALIKDKAVMDIFSVIIDSDNAQIEPPRRMASGIQYASGKPLEPPRREASGIPLEPPRGIPIGNLTSQFFANYYLSAFDHHFKERRGAKKYIRYMDDILIFSESKGELLDIYGDAVLYAKEKLKLALKPPVLGPAAGGAPFLGFLVKPIEPPRRMASGIPTGIYLQQKTKRRYKKRMAEIEYKRKNGALGDLDASRRAESVTAHLLLARSRNFRNTD